MKQCLVIDGSQVTDCENKDCQEAAAALVNLLTMMKSLSSAYKEGLTELAENDPKKGVFEVIIYNLDFMTTHMNGCSEGNCSKAHT